MRFPCTCGRLLEVAESLSGKRVRCPSCLQVVVATEPEIPFAELVEAPPAPPVPPVSRLSKPPPMPATVGPTPLSRAASLIAIAGFSLFGVALGLIVLRPDGVNVPALVLVAGISSLFLLAASSGPKPAPRGFSAGGVVVKLLILVGLAVFACGLFHRRCEHRCRSRAVQVETSPQVERTR